MLSKLMNFEDKVTLIRDTGVQFLDFGLGLDLRRELPGEFVRGQGGRSLSRLLYNSRGDFHYHPARPGQAVAKPQVSVPMDDSARLFDGCWVPVPMLRINPPRQFAEGPETWARARLVALTEEEADQEAGRQGPIRRRSEEGPASSASAPRPPGRQTHRLTLAIDTCVLEESPETRYLAPSPADVQSGASFALAHRADEIGWFPESPWVAGWIQEIFEERAEGLLRLLPEEVASEIQDGRPQAHYLNLLALIGEQARLPHIKLIANSPDDLKRAIQVDMVLDVGNSRTCGVLVEEHPKERDGLRWRYELELRDLSSPHHSYNEPFESRVEFAQAAFGKEHWAHKSGRSGAFLWPTIARVGPEAARLAGRRRGTEGATGISSPKRYLWDLDRFDTGWRFNSAFVRTEIEPRATAAPFCNLINELGTALFELPDEDRMPVFMPHYARSATMMFMLAEVLAQAQSQINGPAQRLRMPNSDFPRHLRSIILTIPPSMPKPEREIFADRVHQAIGLVWKAFGWHPEDDPIDEEGRALAWPPFPRVEVRWDEATCGQVVYLYSETQNTFGGRVDEFFALTRRPNLHAHGTHPHAAGPNRLRVASVDIGGGTTDLVINDYALDAAGRGANVYIVPEQRFRDGFKVAGDDILLELIRHTLIPPVAAALADLGVEDPKALLARLIGSDPVDVQEGVLRQQLALQVLYPAGLAIVKRYEQYDPVAGAEPCVLTLSELIAGFEAPTAQVLAYFAGGVRAQAVAPEPFDLLGVKITLDLAAIHRLFLEDKLEIGRSIRALCEILYLYDCDVLLLTGRPSRLPGIQALFRALLPLPPDRIVAMQDYRTGNWYPFNRQGRIQDPKTTAAVGAMLCILGQGRLPNFFFRAGAFRPYSTVRYLGMLDRHMIIKSDHVFYAGLDLDDPDYRLPEDISFQMRGIMHLGYRQLAAERWIGSPLYVLDFADEKVRERVFREGSLLQVWLQRDRHGGNEKIKVDRVEVADAGAAGGSKAAGGSIHPRAISLKLNTLPDIGLDQDSYWLDSGSILE